MKELKQQMYVQLLYDAEQQAMRLRWIGEVPLQGYKETLLACLDYMRMHDIPLILVDQRELKPLSEAHTKWLYRTWFPQAMEHFQQALRIAILPSATTFRAISSKSIAKRLIDKYGLKISYHQTEKQAFLFLHQE